MLLFFLIFQIFKPVTFLSVHLQDVELEEQSDSRQSIEERLVDEFMSSSYCSATRAELELIKQEKKCSSCSKSRTITYNSSFLHQLRWVLRRTFQNLMLNPQTSVAQVNTKLIIKVKDMTVTNFKTPVVFMT